MIAGVTNAVMQHAVTWPEVFNNNIEVIVGGIVTCVVIYCLFR